MRRTAILMLVLAAALGGGAVYLARGWLQDQMRTAAVAPQQKPQVSLTTVVVAKRPLKFGDRVTREVLNEIKWPADTVPAGSFTTIASILGDGKRRVALREINVNEPVLKDRISGFGGRATLSTVIEEGMRAVTIRVNDVNGVAGFVLPGDRVDVLLTRDWSGRSKNGSNKITNVLMQNIKVLGVDQLADNEKDKPKVARSVTMEVTIDQSQKLALASQVGSLSLTLRNMTNTDPTTHRMVRVRDLVDDNLAKPKPKVAKRKTGTKSTRRSRKKKMNPYANVKVVRGTKASVQEVVSEKAPERGTVRSYPAPTMFPDAKSPPPPAIGETADAPAIEPRQATSAPIRLTPDSAVSADRQAEPAAAKTVKKTVKMPLAKADESRKGATGAAQ